MVIVAFYKYDNFLDQDVNQDDKIMFFLELNKDMQFSI